MNAFRDRRRNDEQKFPQRTEIDSKKRNKNNRTWHHKNANQNKQQVLKRLAHTTKNKTTDDNGDVMNKGRVSTVGGKNHSVQPFRKTTIKKLGTV